VLLVVAVIVGFLFLDEPWRWIVIAVAALIEIAEVLFWLGWNRRRHATVGLETFVGREAIVVSPCLPAGQVRLDGEIWAAVCAAGAQEGERVVVEAIDRLTLTVRPADSG
jgi:membrane protein implicated in regulation of membrane protease activity